MASVNLTVRPSGFLWDIDIPIVDMDKTLSRPGPADMRRRTVKRPRKRARVDLPALLLMFLTFTFLFGFAIGGATVRSMAEATPVEDAVITPEPRQTSPGHSETPILPEEPAQPTPEPEPCRHRNDITCGGNLLSYDLQDVMQDCCEKYSVPYALALAIAEVESRFDPDAKSTTDDYGLMQINATNHDWLRSLGMDPLTPEGNIESGVYIISRHLQTYGDPHLALMAYNNGPAGARKLWEEGIHETAYSIKVMAAYAQWVNLLQS